MLVALIGWACLADPSVLASLPPKPTNARGLTVDPAPSKPIRWETSFWIREDADAGRRSEYVVVGIPVPMGVAAFDPYRFRVIDPGGRVNMVEPGWTARMNSRRAPTDPSCTRGSSSRSCVAEIA